MGATTRTVRRLRLAARSEEAARRFVPMLEDALRCASLPDAGTRLLLVKRLALGHIPAGISSQGLSEWVAARTAAAAMSWVEGGSAGADAATCVAFASPLQARARLAVRLLHGEPCAGWYWPLAVPEFEWHADAASNLRRMAWTIAAWPEAVTALPAWTAEVVRVTATARLATCIAPAEGRALLLRSGIATPVPAPEARVRSDAREEHVAVAGQRARAVSLPVRPPAWLDVLLEAAGVERGQGAPDPAEGANDGALALAEGSASAGEVPQAATLPKRAVPDAAEVRGAPAAGTLRRPSGGAQAHEHLDPARSLVPGEPEQSHARRGAAQNLDPAGDLSPARGGSSAGDAHLAALSSLAAPESWLPPTACGGLLFLLPVLQRLGLPAWLPAGDRAFAALVLRSALQRLQVADHDLAWQLVAREPEEAPPHAARAPSSWSDPLLAPPRRGLPLAVRLAGSRSAQEQAQVWLAAARWWLRRAGGIGMASLVLRPAHLALTATHADVHFDLACVDLRVRRLGLDFDAGWLPWFGRVLSFHYERRPS